MVRHIKYLLVGQENEMAKVLICRPVSCTSSFVTSENSTGVKTFKYLCLRNQLILGETA